ncbi:MAG: S9 family peptidase [Deltaproteobacteria bacterium]
MTTAEKKTIAAFGTWESPLQPDTMVAGQVGLGSPLPSGFGLLWTESRPSEGGRVALVCEEAAGEVADLLDAAWSLRSRAHEYGGGALAANATRLVFSNDADQRLYVRNVGTAAPCPLTPAGKFAFADIALDERRAGLFCVRENHSQAGEAQNEIVRISWAGEEIAVVVAGRDFVAAPRLSPDGTQLAWIAWDHPNMPWDDSEVWLADIDERGDLARARCIAGGPGEAVFQPEWSPAGVLHFVSDKSGWWNLYRWENDQARPLCPMEAEFGLPQWVFGMRTYAFASEDEILCTWGRGGVWQLGRLDTRSGRLQAIDTPFSGFDGIRVDGRHLSFLGARRDGPSAIVSLDLADDSVRIVRESGQALLTPGDISHPETLEIRTPDGACTHAFFYPPNNARFTAPIGELPPLRVKSHGGPTGSARADFDPRIQFWTTRGFAVVDVNYRGSTGYGRAYREALKGHWGVHDVADCEAAALHLARAGRVDAKRLTIQGGSAGGYTTLAALAFTDTFACGASHYGIGDLAALARDTHKFESRYLDALVAPWPAGEAIYAARSPLAHADQLSCPVIFFQGLDDKVVPPNQAEAMVAALKAKGIRVEYIALAGEGHGFRRAESIIKVLNRELAFFCEVLGIPLC